MSHCAVYGCENYYRKTKQSGIKYFSFPKDKQIREKWEHCCQRQDPLPKLPRICSQHFKEEDYYKSLQQKLLNYSPVRARTLKPDAVPTINLPGGSSLENASRRAERHRKRIRKNHIREILIASIKRSNKTDREGDTTNSEVSENTMAAQSDVMKHNQEILEKLKELEEKNQFLNLKTEELATTNSRHGEKRKMHEVTLLNSREDENDAATPTNRKQCTPLTTNQEESFYGKKLKNNSDTISEYMLQKMELELAQLRELHQLKIQHEKELHHRRLLLIQLEEARAAELYELQKQQIKELHDEQMKALYK